MGGIVLRSRVDLEPSHEEEGPIVHGARNGLLDEAEGIAWKEEEGRDAGEEAEPEFGGEEEEVWECGAFALKELGGKEGDGQREEEAVVEVSRHPE